MAQIGQGRMGTLLILVMSLLVLMTVLAYYYYMLNTKRMKASDSEAIYAPGEKPNIPSTAIDRENTRTAGKKRSSNNSESLLPAIIRIRKSLAKFNPGGYETHKFKNVFDRLEKAAIYNEVNDEELGVFSVSLKISLDDGTINASEMDNLLEILESAIIDSEGD
ncbi:hypothetical protein KAH81_01225 [bacterium]|nr:hypothetical protein [bacterium]